MVHIVLNQNGLVHLVPIFHGLVHLVPIFHGLVHLVPIFHGLVYLVPIFHGLVYLVPNTNGLVNLVPTSSWSCVSNEVLCIPHLHGLTVTEKTKTCLFAAHRFNVYLLGRRVVVLLGHPGK